MIPYIIYAFVSLANALTIVLCEWVASAVIQVKIKFLDKFSKNVNTRHHV